MSRAYEQVKRVLKMSKEWLFILGLGGILIVVDFPLSVVLVLLLQSVWKVINVE